MFFGICKGLHNNVCKLAIEHFCVPKRNLALLAVTPTSLQYPPTNVLSVSIDFPILYISCQYNHKTHTVCGGLCVVFFT